MQSVHTQHRIQSKKLHVSYRRNMSLVTRTAVLCVSLLRTVSFFVSLTPNHIPRSRGIGDLPRLASAAQRRRLKCDGTRAETRFRLSAKRTSPFKSAGASVQPTTCSRGVRINGRNGGYTMFRGSVKSTGYPLHSPVSPSLPLPCVTVCHHISIGLYLFTFTFTKNGTCYRKTTLE